MPLFLDMNRNVWLLVALVVMLAVIYFVFYPLYFYACRLSGPVAIRLAWSMGVVMLLVFLLFLSPLHAPYLAFWSDVQNFPNFLAIFLPLGAIVIYFWASMPRLQ